MAVRGVELRQDSKVKTVVWWGGMLIYVGVSAKRAEPASIK